MSQPSIQSEHGQGELPEVVIVDFDGVVAPDNTAALCAAVYRVVRSQLAYDEQAFRQLFAALVPMPLHAAIELLIQSLDLQQQRRQLIAAINSVDGEIEAAVPFLMHCAAADVSVQLLSSGDARSAKYRRLRPFLAQSQLYVNPSFCKLNPRHFERFLSSRRIAAERAWYIDDCPAALHAARQAGVGTTVLMTNAVFPGAEDEGRYIDLVVDDWRAVEALMPTRRPWPMVA